MKKFLVLYCSTPAAQAQMAQATPEQMQAAVGVWMQWYAQAQHAIEVSSPVGNAQKLTPAPSSFASPIDGFSVMQAEDAAALHALLKGHPHFQGPGAWVEVLELQPIPGM